MKKTIFTCHRIVAAILVIVIATCFIGLTPSFARSEKDIQKEKQAATNQLIQMLMRDGVVNEAKGFVVEKRQNKLYIDGKQQTDAIAGKYLAVVQNQETVRVQVFSLQDRIRMHQGSSLIQVLSPVSFSSGCVDYGPTKKGEGC